MKWLALLAIFVVAACGSFGPTQPRSLSLAYKAGDTYKYKLHSTSKQAAGMGGMSIPIEIDMSASEAVTVKSVDASGVADLSIALSNFTLKSVSGGVTNTTTGLPVNTFDIKIRPDGTVVSFEGSELANGSPITAFSGLGGGFFIAAVLPSNAVKPGDTWTKTYDQASPDGAGKVHITSKSAYLRDESFNGVTAAVVETKSDGTVDLTGPPQVSPGTDAGLSIKGTFTTDVTTWIDPNGHRVMKTHSTSTDEATLDFPTASASQSPMMHGPLTAKGDATTDLTPA